jgi:hypothetical protein
MEFQDCDGDHSKVIEKYVELYLKVPFVIAFIEKDMVKRGMDVNVGVHVFNSMWSNKEKKKHTAHTHRALRQMLGLGHHCCNVHNAIIPEVAPNFVDVLCTCVLVGEQIFFY